MKTARKQSADKQEMETLTIAVPKPIADFIRLEAKRNLEFGNDGTTFERCLLNAIGSSVQGQLDEWPCEGWVGTEFEKDWRPTLQLLREKMAQMPDESPWKMTPGTGGKPVVDPESVPPQKRDLKKTSKKPVAAIVALGLSLLVGASVQGQVIVTPTHYSHSIEGQNDLGRWTVLGIRFPNWTTERIDTHTMTPGQLVVIRTVYYQSLATYYKIPKMTEDREIYRGGSGGFWILTNAQSITWLAPKANGSGWIASTNSFTPDPNNPISLQWKPAMSGRVETGNDYWRTIETGSGLDCMCNNLATAPRMLTMPCWTDNSVWFLYTNRFAPGERKFITIGGGSAFRFDLSTITDVPTL